MGSTAFDGVWATRRLTIDEIRAASAAAGIETAHFDEVVGPNPGFNKHAVFEIKISNGRWTQFEVDDGVPSGPGWSGRFSTLDENTFVAKDDASRCEITYDLSLADGDLSVDIAKDVCPDANDIVFQTAIYESAPFHLIEPPNPTYPEPSPDASPSSPGPTSGLSTSDKRLTAHDLGSTEGANLGYLEYLPPDYDDAALSPLIVFLHGSGESGDGTGFNLLRLEATGIPALIVGKRWPDSRPFVVLMPQHEEAPPDWCFTPDEVDQFLEFALGHYAVDPSRVYLTGLSCGAMGVWNYLGEHGTEIVAAAVPIAGYGIGAVDTIGCSLAALPIWAFHGDQDPNVAIRGDAYPINYLNTCTNPRPVDARLTVYPFTGHDSWTRTYNLSAGNDIYSWMLSYSK